MIKGKILIATSSFGEFSSLPIDHIVKSGYEVTFNPKKQKLTNIELDELLQGVDGVIAGTEKYSKDILIKHKGLKVISRLGVGLDNIDLSVTDKINTKILTTSTTPAKGVSELVLGLIIDLSRKITLQNNALKSGIWKKEMGQLLNGKTLGIIGMGTIGKTLVDLVKGFNFNILAFDKIKNLKFSKENTVEYCTLEKLIKSSDIISIHLNLSKNTENLVNEKLIKKMKKNLILINTSRGEIINEKALYNALKSGLIHAAGLDVFNSEPYNGELVKLDNVILTPHIGSYAKELRVKMEIESANNLIKGLTND
ncbi:phosphoglycerate dehydrogenase [Candidatus Marinimicrobia bacterium]|nr:phosphoglycerate dehydrogenase [Candidatus Neomarinimicrobiota bacterium]